MAVTNYSRVSAVVVAAIAAALLAMLVYSSLASALSTTAVPGTTITVNSKGDGTKTGNCTPREAIEAANMANTTQGENCHGAITDGGKSSRTAGVMAGPPPSPFEML